MKSPPEEKFDTIRRTFSNSQLASRLERYNKTVRNSFVMQLRKDYSFTGYIRVELELTRPITVLDGNEPPQVKYLPKNTVKAIYLTSQTSASQVVKALLQKFNNKRPEKIHVMRADPKGAQGGKPRNYTTDDGP